MSADRELLELAAKAAGVNVFSFIDDPVFGTGINSDETDSGLWNPLTDDGDALRLAVKLNMTVSMNPAHAEAIWYDEDRSVTHSLEQWDNGMEPEEWTRRAIVRAAAEIGRAMP